MALTSEFVYVTSDGEVMDQIAARYYPEDPNKGATWIYETNPGVPFFGARLPAGVRLVLKPLPSSNVATATPVRVWTR